MGATFDPLDMPLLENLHLYNCSKLKIKGDLQSLTRLKCLTIDSCREVFANYSTKDQQKGKGLQVDRDEGLRSVTHIEADGSSLLRHEYHLILRSHPSLRELRISECYIMISLDLDMPLLEDLNLENCSELKIKGDMQSLTHLKRLKLVRCSNLFTKYSTKDKRKGKGLQVHQDEGLRSLIHIEADDCSLWHHEYHLILGCLPSLPILKLENLRFSQFTNQQNLWFQELTALKEIHFSYCEFEHLPVSLSLLSSLKMMSLRECNKLESLSDSMPPNLQQLQLMYCSPNLVQPCVPYEGQDWQFTSNIPIFHMDKTTTRYARHWRIMKIQKPPISDAIGTRACASCGKTFEVTDFVLYD